MTLTFDKGTPVSFIGLGASWEGAWRIACCARTCALR